MLQLFPGAAAKDNTDVINVCRSAGGSVSVHAVTEGRLYVMSGSGAVQLGKIKATTAYVDTNGMDMLV